MNIENNTFPEPQGFSVQDILWAVGVWSSRQGVPRMLESDWDGYSVADIALLTTVDFAGFIGIAMPDDAANLRAWHARVSARPSAAA